MAGAVRSLKYHLIQLILKGNKIVALAGSGRPSIQRCPYHVITLPTKIGEGRSRHAAQSLVRALPSGSSKPGAIVRPIPGRCWPGPVTGYRGPLLMPLSTVTPRRLRGLSLLALMVAGVAGSASDTGHHQGQQGQAAQAARSNGRQGHQERSAVASHRARPAAAGNRPNYSTGLR